jgi:hypothetical protein
VTGRPSDALSDFCSCIVEYVERDGIGNFTYIPDSDGAGRGWWGRSAISALSPKPLRRRRWTRLAGIPQWTPPPRRRGALGRSFFLFLVERQACRPASRCCLRWTPMFGGSTKTSGIDPFPCSCTAASHANLISRRPRRWRAVPSIRSFFAPKSLNSSPLSKLAEPPTSGVCRFSAALRKGHPLRMN